MMKIWIFLILLVIVSTVVVFCDPIVRLKMKGGKRKGLIQFQPYIYI